MSKTALTRRIEALEDEAGTLPQGTRVNIFSVIQGDSPPQFYTPGMGQSIFTIVTTSEFDSESTNTKP